MKILNQNLQEGQKIVEKPATSLTKTASKTAVRTQSSKMQIRSSSTIAVVTPKEGAKKPRATINFSFTMDSLVIDLLNSDAVSRWVITNVLPR